mmetsp:Transcript_116807/g.325485  ORF Transcript_116807/g.325485 Transcript_116807/m.325485 type:complete len:230 (-) Transcript_116807:1042-1731(-)
MLRWGYRTASRSAKARSRKSCSWLSHWSNGLKLSRRTYSTPSSVLSSSVMVPVQRRPSSQAEALVSETSGRNTVASDKLALCTFPFHCVHVLFSLSLSNHTSSVAAPGSSGSSSLPGLGTRASAGSSPAGTGSAAVARTSLFQTLLASTTRVSLWTAPSGASSRFASVTVTSCWTVHSCLARSVMNSASSSCVRFGSCALGVAPSLSWPSPPRCLGKCKQAMWCGASVL